MTSIVGYIDRKNKKAYIGGDTQGSSSSIKMDRKDIKVFEKEGILFGFTTSYRMGQLIKYSLNIPRILSKEDEHEYMVARFIPELIKLYDESKYLQKDHQGQAQGGIFIAIVNDRLFEIESDFQVNEPNYDYTSVGCGFKLCLGSLFTTYKMKNMTVKEKVELALESAIEFDPYVGKRITILERDLT